MAAVVVYACHAAPTFWSMVDDAYISARYAELFVAGEGLGFSPGEPLVEGYTNLLWVLLLAAGRLAHLPIAPLMVGLGLLFGVAAVLGAFVLARTLSPENDERMALAAPWLLALSPHFAAASTNGLETSMWLAALCWGPALWLCKFRAGAPILALLCTVRPEGFLVAWLWVAVPWLERADWRPTRPDLAGAVTIAGGQGLVLAWRQFTYGQWVPNTWFAKADPGTDLLIDLNGRYLGYDGWLWPMVGVGVVALCLWGPAIRRVAAAAVGIALTLIALRVILWMPGARLMLPLWLSFAIMVGSLPYPRGRIVGLVVALATALLIASSVGTHTRRYDRVHSVLPNNATQQVASLLAESVPAGEWVAVRDAGVFAYYVGPELKVYETHVYALTRPHPNGPEVSVDDHPQPAVLVTTTSDLLASHPKYGGDKQILQTLAAKDYTYLGRFKQHHRRFYDVYVRSEWAPDIPEGLITNHAGGL